MKNVEYKRKKVTFIGTSGYKSKMINIAQVKLSPKKEEQIIEKFNDEARVIENLGGCTYYIDKKYREMKSSSLDELQEMYKCAWLGVPVQERKCFFHKA